MAAMIAPLPGRRDRDGPLAAAINDFQKLVFGRARVVALRQDAGQHFLRLGQRQGFLEINVVNPLRAGLVGTIDLIFRSMRPGRKIAGQSGPPGWRRG